MIDRIDIRPNDRVLLLSIPDPAIVAMLAKKLTGGLLVGLGQDEEVRAARRAARDLANVMFVPGDPEEIPWQEGFFSKVIDCKGAWDRPAQVARDLARILSPGGIACLSAAAAPVQECLRSAGFTVFASDEAMLLVRRE